MSKTYKVIIRRCDHYNPDIIAGIVGEGMRDLGARPFGRVLLKPNAVIAHPEIFPHAFTKKEFLEGVLRAVKHAAVGLKELAVGERSGITVPTRYCFRNAGYLPAIKRSGAKIRYFEEERQVPVELKAEGRLRDRIYVPGSVLDSDFLINLPKFKAHPWTRMTLSLKNFIGIQDDRHRLVDHNSYLEQKIVDLQEVITPGFIAVDGIVAGQKMMLTPDPFPMGAVIMGTNSCAVDTVGCHMVHLDPNDVIHLKLASARGLGPMSLNDIEVGGDFPLEEIRERTKVFEFCMERVDDYFGKESGISCTVGTFPESHSRDYCWGGCPGALQEAMHIFRGFNPSVEQEMRKVRYVVGRVKGPLHLAEDERVLFAGDCTRWQGEINGRPVKIEGNYRTKEEIDPERTPSNDLVLRMGLALWRGFTRRSSRFIHAPGCTVSVADHVNYVSALGKIPNPNLDPRLIIPLSMAYMQMRIRRLWNRIFGQWRWRRRVPARSRLSGGRRAGLLP